jgi:hypothetical protein
MDPMLKLRRFIEPRPEPVRAPEERCGFCSVPIPEEHGHVAEVEKRNLLCVCRACYLLFEQPGAARGKYRSVPSRYLRLSDLALTDAQWDRLQIPVGMAFFFQNSALNRTLAFYPSPAGAAESALPLDTWDEIVQANPALRGLAADVEAMLVRRMREGREYYIVPIDACYELAGLMRRRWKGFDGGEEARRAIEAFFAGLRERSEHAGSARCRT